MVTTAALLTQIRLVRFQSAQPNYYHTMGREMISQEQFTPTFELDVGRPDIVNDETRQFWDAFHSLVETWPSPIAVNTAFHATKALIASNQGCLGGGMQYKFWFTSEEDKDAFLVAARAL